MKRPFVYTPEDINKEFAILWKFLRRNKSNDIESVDLGVGPTDTTKNNTIQFNDNGDVVYVDTEGNVLSLGGISSNTIYTGDNQLAGDRTVDLNSNFLVFEDTSEALLTLNPDNFQSIVRATDIANGEAYLVVTGDALGSNVSFLLHSDIGGGSIASIEGSSTINNITYTAEEHLVIMSNNGSFGISDGVDKWLEIDITSSTITHTADLHQFLSGDQTLLRINPLNQGGQSFLRAYDNSVVENAGIFIASAHSGGADARVGAEYDDGDIKAEISFSVNSTEGTLTYVADHHIFDGGQGINEFADNAAALGGGLIVGELYRTGDLLKIVH